jgi:DNA replication protein DnaC
MEAYKRIDNSFSIGGINARNVGRTCPKHGPYTAMQTWAGGKMRYESPCPACEAERHARELPARQAAAKAAAEKAEAERRRAQLEKTLESSAIPLRYRNCRFETWVCDAPEADRKRRAMAVAESYVKKFDQLAPRGIGMVFTGPCGTGKTYLACSVLLALLDTSAGVYTTAAGVANRVARSWGVREEGKTTNDVLRVYIKAPLLVLDELAKEGAKPLVRDIVSQIIYARYDALLPTIYITNAEWPTLVTAIGEQEAQRIKETCKAVTFNWPSRRQADVNF